MTSLSKGCTPCFVAFATLLLFPTIAASEPQILWNRTYGGPGDEIGTQLVQGWGDYVMVGYTTSFGALREDFYLLKIDDAGNILWNKTYERSTQDLAYCITDSGDGGFIIAGMAQGTQGETKGQRAYLLTVDDRGEKMWDKTYRNKSVFHAVTASRDGGFVAVGGGTVPDHAADVYVLKVDAEGNALWEKICGGSYFDEADAIVRDGDGGFLVAGVAESGPTVTKGDVYLLRIDGDGNTLWEKTYGGNSEDWATCIAEAGNGEFIVAGATESFGNGEEDVYVLRIDGEGEKVWERAYGGSGRECVNAITGTFGGYVLAGWTTSFGATDRDVYILKVDEEGNMVWNLTFGGPGFDLANSVVQSWEGGFLVAGRTYGWPYPSQQIDILVLSGYEGQLPIGELLPLFWPLALAAILGHLYRLAGP